MPWGKLDDTLYDHPKLDKLGPDRNACVGLWARSISWCNRYLTDGMIPAARAEQFADGHPEHLVLLVRAHLFDRGRGGYKVHDFLEFNDSKVDVEKRKAASTERQRRHRGLTEVTATSRRDKRPRHTTPARDSRPDPSRPVPTDTSPSGDVAPAMPKPNGHGPLAGILGTVAANLGAPAPELPVNVGLEEGEGRVFAFLARFGAAIRPDAPMGLRLLGLIERRGVEEVLQQAAKMTRAGGKMSDRQWVFGLEQALEVIPGGKESRAADLAVEHDARNRRIVAQTQARRLEQFRYTGKWDPAFGPEPTWQKSWGARP